MYRLTFLDKTPNKIGSDNSIDKNKSRSMNQSNSNNSSDTQNGNNNINKSINNNSISKAWTICNVKIEISYIENNFHIQSMRVCLLSFRISRLISSIYPTDIKRRLI